MLRLHIFEGFRQFTYFPPWRDPYRQHKTKELRTLTCLYTAKGKHVSHVLITVMQGGGVYAFEYLFACLQTVPSNLHMTVYVPPHFLSFALACLYAGLPHCSHDSSWYVATFVGFVYGRMWLVGWFSVTYFELDGNLSTALVRQVLKLSVMCLHPKHNMLTCQLISFSFVLYSKKWYIYQKFKKKLTCGFNLSLV